MPYDYDAQSILKRLMDGLQSDVNRLQGGFCMDNLQAVAEELARYRAMILEYAVEQTMLDTADGEYLDRKALEYNEERLDGEADDVFRARLLNKIRQPITSGNANHYVYWARQVPGVGAARCIPTWDGPGTVKVVILSAAMAEPDDALIAAVRSYVETQRPVGASVTISKAVPVDVTINVKATLEAGSNPDEVREQIAAAIQSYCTESAFDLTTLSYHKVGDLMFDVTGVADISSYTLNGKTASVTMTAEQFARLKEVVLDAS